MSPILHFESWIRTKSFGNVDPVLGTKANSGPKKLLIHVRYLYPVYKLLYLRWRIGISLI